MAEIDAQKDLLRAEFAIYTRRLELNLDRLKEKSASLLAQAGKNSDVINRLSAERDALRAEVLGIRTQLEALKRRLRKADERPADNQVYVVRRMTPRRIVQ